MLTQFVLERPQLQAGGCLLPDLVEFYLWLHTQLAYIVSYDKATELKIGQVVERAVERYSKDFGTHIKELYERVKGSETETVHPYVYSPSLFSFSLFPPSALYLSLRYSHISHSYFSGLQCLCGDHRSCHRCWSMCCSTSWKQVVYNSRQYAPPSLPVRLVIRTCRSVPLFNVPHHQIHQRKKKEMIGCTS